MKKLIIPFLATAVCFGTVATPIVDVEVINTSTGDSWSDSISGYGSTSIYLSGNNDIYLIYINTELGTYSGKFEI